MQTVKLLKQVYFELLLKKSLNLTLGSQPLYLELSNQGNSITLLTYLMDSKTNLTDEVLGKLEELDDPRLVWSCEDRNVYFAQKKDFGAISPDSLALLIVQFLKEAAVHKEEILPKSAPSYAYVPRGTMS